MSRFEQIADIIILDGIRILLPCRLDLATSEDRMTYNLLKKYKYL